jgi:hypothetical protein
MGQIMKWLTKPKRGRCYFTVTPRDFFSRLVAAKKSLCIYIDPFGHFCMLWFEKKNINIFSTFVSEKSLVWKALKERFPDKTTHLGPNSDFSWLHEIKWGEVQKKLDRAFTDYLDGKRLVRIYQ